MTDIKKYNSLIITLIVSSMTVYGINNAISNCLNASYIQIAVNSILALVLYLLLYNHNAVNSFVYSNGIIIKLFCIITVFALLVYSSAFVADTSFMINKFFMQKTPVFYISIFLMFPVIFGGFYGFKSVSRYAGIIWIIFVLLTIMLLIFSFHQYNTDNLFPVFGSGLSDIMKGSFDISLYAGMLIFYICISGCSTTSLNIKKQSTKIILMSGAFGVAISFALSLLLPYQAVAFSDNPYLTIASCVQMNFLLERSEIIVLLLLVSFSFITVSAMCSAVYLLSERVLNITDKKGITGSVVTIIYVLSVLIDKFAITKTVINISAYIIFGLSLLLPVVSLVRRGIVR